MSWPGFFVLVEPLAPPGPQVLEPQQAQEHLNEHLAWEERRLLRHCYWALAVQASGGLIMLATGQLPWVLVTTAMSMGLLVVEKRRWRRSERHLPNWLVEGVARWVSKQPSPESALASLRIFDTGLEWYHLVSQVSAVMTAKACPVPVFADITIEHENDN